MDYTTLPPDESIERVRQALTARGVEVEILENKAAALERLRVLIPADASITTAGSLTLQQIGFEALLISGMHPWHNLKGEMLAEKDPAKQAELRRQLLLADYIVGSVHAIAESGEVVVVSQTGSQLAPYIMSSRNVIWVAGTQKIVPTLEDAMRRARDYCAHMVEERALKENGRKGGGKIGKTLIFENEMPYLHRQVHLLLVKEVLGF
jgi:L-lactate utilization protein LutC